MLQLGDRIVYGIHGVCCVVDIEQRIIDRKKADYYVLEPVDQPGAKFYVPTHNQIAVSKLRPLLTLQELEDLLQSPETHADIWIADENRRKQRYRELINSGDRASLICMIRSLHKHKEAQLSAGRKFHLCDENFLKDAQKLLTSEFSVVLNIPPSDVRAYIESKLSE